MTLLELLKKFAYQIGTLGFAGVVIGALSTWWSIFRVDGDTAIATEIGNLMILLAVFLPLVFAGTSYLERETIHTVPRSRVTIAFGIIGLFSGIFAVLVYFFIGFQVPTQFAGADTFILFDILVPVMLSTGLIVSVITAIAGALIGFSMGASAT